MKARGNGSMGQGGKGDRKFAGVLTAASIFLAGLLGAAFVLFRPRPRNDEAKRSAPPAPGV